MFIFSPSIYLRPRLISLRRHNWVKSGGTLRRHIWGTLRKHIWGGTFESNPRMFESHFNPKKWETGTYIWFAKKARMLPVKCASSDSYVPPTMVAVVDKLLDWAIPTKYHSTRTDLWQKLPAKLSYRMVPKSGCAYIYKIHLKPLITLKSTLVLIMPIAHP